MVRLTNRFIFSLPLRQGCLQNDPFPFADLHRGQTGNSVDLAAAWAVKRGMAAADNHGGLANESQDRWSVGGLMWGTALHGIFEVRK
jgi:hypothetical protein